MGNYPLAEKAPQELVIDNSLQQPEVFSTAYYYQHDRFGQKIAQLGKLQDGWDGNGALAPSPESLESISLIVNSLSKSVLMSCALFPANDSGVYLQGRFQRGRLSVYVKNGLMTYIAKAESLRETGQEVAVSVESAARLSEIASMMFA